jgi:hypothetical protein
MFKTQYFFKTFREKKFKFIEKIELGTAKWKHKKWYISFSYLVAIHQSIWSILPGFTESSSEKTSQIKIFPSQSVWSIMAWAIAAHDKLDAIDKHNRVFIGQNYPRPFLLGRLGYDAENESSIYKSLFGYHIFKCTHIIIGDPWWLRHSAQDRQMILDSSPGHTRFISTCSPMQLDWCIKGRMVCGFPVIHAPKRSLGIIWKFKNLQRYSGLDIHCPCRSSKKTTYKYFSTAIDKSLIILFVHFPCPLARCDKITNLSCTNIILLLWPIS